MNSFTKIWMAITIILLSFTACDAQIKNAKTENITIFGNCSICEAAIEKAGNWKKAANVDWNKDTKMAKITYDANKTNLDVILKRIALAGYDSEQFLAPNDVYAKLPECCQYERKTQTLAKVETPKTLNQKMETHDHSAINETNQEVEPLKTVFENYFAIKDALVKTDGNTASAQAKFFLTAINAVKMEKLSTEEHTVWMKILKDLKEDTEQIANTEDVSQQRNHFMMFSMNVYALIKVSKQETPTYFQHCPMANDGKGANWLSKENTIKNPYYGSQMLTCGKTVETIE